VVVSNSRLWKIWALSSPLQELEMGVIDNSAFSALVVDDDGEVRCLLTRALVANGIQVDSAPNGLIASELLLQRTYGVGLEPQAERILKVASLLH